MNDILINLQWFTTIGLCGQVAIGVYGSFGLIACVASAVFLIAGWLVAFILGIHFLNAGHINYYWLSRGHLHNDPVDVRLALDAIRKKIEASEESIRNPNVQLTESVSFTRRASSATM